MAQFDWEGTIAAIATAQGEGGIGIVRLSGTDALEIAARIFKSSRGRPFQSFHSHTVHHGHVCDRDGGVVDEALVTVFRAPHSYTREHMVEVSTHGGPRILKSVLDLLIQAGARHAEPGEFTKRAFLNGRLDLAQAEAVCDLVRAKTESARAQAVRHLQGEFSRSVQALKERILKLCAHVEAYVDFPEEDIEVYSDEDFLREFDEAASQVRSLLGTFERGSLLRDGVLTVIVGRPNVGKSSLLNTLLDRDRAIVSEIPGTTRDALEEELEIEGVLVRIVDTAGIHLQPDALEEIGIRRTRRCMEEAQLFLMVVDGSQELTREDLDLYKEIQKRKHVVVVNKIDLLSGRTPEKWVLSGEEEPCLVSAKTREGLSGLEQRIAGEVANGGLEGERAFVSRLRHKEALAKCLEALVKAREALASRLSLEFVAFDLREALERLGEIVGEIYTDDLLDVIFREFCIGK